MNIKTIFIPHMHDFLFISWTFRPRGKSFPFCSHGDSESDWLKIRLVGDSSIFSRAKQHFRHLIGTQVRTPLLYRNVSYWLCKHLIHLIHCTFTRLTWSFFFSTLFKQQRRRTWKIQVTTRFKRCPLRYRHTISLIRPCNLELVIKWDHEKSSQWQDN